MISGILKHSALFFAAFVFSAPDSPALTVFPQIWEIYDNADHSQVLDNGVKVSVTMLPVNGVQGGGIAAFSDNNYTEISAEPTTSWAENGSSAAPDWQQYLEVILSFDTPVKLTGTFETADVDWEQMVSVFAMNNDTLVQPDSTVTGSQLTLATNTKWTNQPYKPDGTSTYSLADDTIDTVIAPSSGGIYTDSRYTVTHGFQNAVMTDLLFIFGEAGTGSTGSGGAVVNLDFNSSDANVSPAPEPSTVWILLLASGLLFNRRV